jgi:protein TonB
MTARALALSDDNRSAEFMRWSLAGAIVLAGHLALVAGYWMLPEPDADGAAASPVVIVELAPVPVAPASQQDLAPGPDMVEATPTPPPSKQTAPEEVQPVPKMDAPAEVTLPEPEPKPQEQKVEESNATPQTDTPPVQVAPAPQTTAAPRSDLNTAAVPAAPAPGSVSDRAAIASWRDLLLTRLQQSKRYPAAAEARREQGVVTLNFVVDRKGHVLARNIVKSSGSSALDDEVMAMVKRAEPLPAFPPAMTQGSISLTVPIRFSLR